MPLSFCPRAGCSALTPGGLCESHKQEQVKFQNRKPSSMDARRFYSSQPWRRLRALVLEESPLCEGCLAGGITKLAQEVHHIQDRRERPDLALARKNLQPLCKACHSRHTAKKTWHQHSAE